MGYQSKTYSLSDEVVAAIEAARERGLSPNKYLRLLIGIDVDVVGVEAPGLPAITRDDIEYDQE